MEAMQSHKQSLDEIFRDRVRRQPEHPAILGPAGAPDLTYAQLDALVGDAASWLQQAGLAAGDALGLHCPSGRDYILSTYAAWRLGACVVPIPVELVDGEKRHLLESIKVDWVLSPEGGASFVAPFRAGDPVLSPAGDRRRFTLLPTRSPRRHPAGYERVDAAFIRFTSGTTGRSKGVVLSHATIAERIAAANAALQLGPEDRVVWLLSMSYHFAVSIAGYLSLGSTIVLPSNHLGQEVLATAVRHDATFIYGSPAHYEWMADAVGGDSLPSLRLAVSTTAPLAGAVGRRFQDRFGVPVAQALGLIEVGLPCINVGAAAGRPESVGRPLPAYDLRLDDVGFGPHCREILFRGPGCLDAYYDPWQTRDEIMPDGWFRTGDVGETDEEGRLILRGRAKDVINIMGMKFFPHEVEEVLATHPDVEEACVVSERDARFGEAALARVVLRRPDDQGASERGLLDYCRQRMASYKVPSRIEFVPVLARTPSGKVLHRTGPEA